MVLPSQTHVYYSPSPWPAKVRIDWSCAITSPRKWNGFSVYVFNPLRGYGGPADTTGGSIGASRDTHGHLVVHNAAMSRCVAGDQTLHNRAYTDCPAVRISISGTFSGDETDGNFSLTVGSAHYQVRTATQMQQADAIYYAQRVVEAVRRNDWHTVCGYVATDTVLTRGENDLRQAYQVQWSQLTAYGRGSFGTQYLPGSNTLSVPSYTVPVTVRRKGHLHRGR
jgi:hypothetical protein